MHHITPCMMHTVRLYGCHLPLFSPRSRHWKKEEEKEKEETKTKRQKKKERKE